MTPAKARPILRSRPTAPPIFPATGCHIEAGMVARGEKVGNLVCPSLFDLGERAKMAISSVNEGEEKPLKYPTMLAAANCVSLSKTAAVLHGAPGAGWLPRSRKCSARRGRMVACAFAACERCLPTPRGAVGHRCCRGPGRLLRRVAWLRARSRTAARCFVGSPHVGRPCSGRLVAPDRHGCRVNRTKGLTTAQFCRHS